MKFARLLLLVIAGPLLTLGNWLLQCSSCIDQVYYSDSALKTNIKNASLEILFAQLKQVRLREFDHKEHEFSNKFFSRTQLGVIAQELQSIMPSAIANVPERRWTTMDGVSMATKNVLLLRDSHMLMVAIGSVQLLAKKAEYWETAIAKWIKDLDYVMQEQKGNRLKHEDLLDQVVRIVAKLEFMLHAMVEAEGGFTRRDVSVSNFKVMQDTKYHMLTNKLEQASNRSVGQDRALDLFQADFHAMVEQESLKDLVEKRKACVAEVEVNIVKNNIEQMRHSQEQQTTLLRDHLESGTDDYITKSRATCVAYEYAQRKATNLTIMLEQEASNMRQEESLRKGKKEFLLLKLASEGRNAELDLQGAVEIAKIEQAAKIRVARENEDIHLREKKLEWQEKRQQTLAAIRETAGIAVSWVSLVYSSPWNLMLAIGSVIACIGGVYVAREMAILLRVQLGKRLGRPSLLRATRRRGVLQTLWMASLRLLRLQAPHGSEFDDVVLHPRLHQQVMRLADATRTAKRRHMPLQHVMFYGPPGTGKTMVAERFAEYSGLEYAIMSGGDVAPLGDLAVTELHKLFKWVHRSQRGVLLFIDEADAFLSSRGGCMSEHLRNALTTILYHTGTTTSQFMMVIATNRPHDLDGAVLNRIDESVEFGLPGVDAREELVKLYFRKYITMPLKIMPLKPSDLVITGGLEANSKWPESGLTSPISTQVSTCSPSSTATTLSNSSSSRPGLNFCLSPRQSYKPAVPSREGLVTEQALAEVARQTSGFSGREIAKMIMSLQTNILFNAKRAASRRNIRLLVLEQKLLFEVVYKKVLEHKRLQDFQVSGYSFESHETRSGG